MSAQLHQLALAFSPNVGNVMARNLISYLGSADAVFAASATKLKSVPGIGEVIAQGILQKTGIREAEKELVLLEKKGIELLFSHQPAYPTRMKTLYDAPFMMYQKGPCQLNTPRVVGMVGTRNATDYGRRITEEIVEGLKPYNVLISSGLAYGIDIAAHRACLKFGVPTVGVMASGIDIIYPAVHQKTAQEMLENGALLTEARMGVKPDAMRFPARNRIIAGMSDVTIVVEAAAKGGALITAEYANNYNRDVFAVPGNLHSSYSEGCNKIIRENKAQIFTSVETFIESMNWNAATPSRESLKTPEVDMSHFTHEETQIMALLSQHRQMQVDDLSWHSQIPMNKLASLLLNLEFQGFVRTLPGKKYVLG